MIFSIDEASLVIVFASLLLDQKFLSEINKLSSSNFFDLDLKSKILLSRRKPLSEPL